MDEAGDGRLSAPAAGRNRLALREALAPHLSARQGVLLEIGSGTGEHAADWAAAFPDLSIQPSDPIAAHRASIDAWAADSGCANILPALGLDATGIWTVTAPLAAVVAVNVIHISPWAVAEAIVSGAARHLGPAGVLLFYGPFRRGGRHTAPSNAAFDDSLRSRDPSWGVRDLEAVADLARTAGFGPPQVTEMPANNLVLAFDRSG